MGLTGVLTSLVAWLASPVAGSDVLLFLTGIVPAWVLGLVAIHKLSIDAELEGTPFAYRAMAEKKSALALLLFISFLGLVSFPITPAFIGQDLLIAHVSANLPWLVPLMAVSFVLSGIGAAAMYQRLCLGRPVEIRDTVIRLASGSSEAGA